MSSLFRPSSNMYSELNRLQGMLAQMLNPGGQASIRALSGATFPVINVGSTPEAVEVMALAPGLDPSALQLTVDRGLLIISGERKAGMPNGGGAEGEKDERKDVNVYAQERFSGRFRRVVTLPEDADPARVPAHYRDGLLRITIAKRESSRPRRIEVS